MNKVERKQQQDRKQAVDDLIHRITEEIRTVNTYAACPTYRNLEGPEQDAAYICVHEAQAYLVQRVTEIYAGFKP